jgi:hypothetical protein
MGDSEADRPTRRTVITIGLEEIMESYKLLIALAAMDEFAEQRKASRANAALASHDAADMGRAISAQRHEPSLFARLRAALGSAWMHGRALVLRGERRVSTAPSLGPD